MAEPGSSDQDPTKQRSSTSAKTGSPKIHSSSAIFLTIVPVAQRVAMVRVM